MLDLETPRHPQKSDLGNRTIPIGKNIYIERRDFFDLHGPEGQKAGGKPPKGFKRLLPDKTVRLKFAFCIQCDKIVRNETTQEPVELICSYLPETLGGNKPDDATKKPKGIIHWVEAKTAIPCTVRQYDRLFLTEEPGSDFLDEINPDSLQVFPNAKIEPGVALDAVNALNVLKSQRKEEQEKEEFSDDLDFEPKGGPNKVYPSYLAYQFERNGYYAMDKDTTMKKLIFNRVATLRDTWGVPKQKQPNNAQPPQQQQQQQQRSSANANANKSPIADVRRIAFRVVTIVKVEEHPEDENLWVCKVDCGNDMGEWTVVVGKRDNLDIPLHEKIVAVTNLKPSNRKGIVSQATFLFVKNALVGRISDLVPNGELLQFENQLPSEPDAMLKSRGAVRAWQRVLEQLKIDSNGNVVYVDDENKEFVMTSSGGPIQTLQKE
eukprot:CAMPEP_0116826524 /NCGR_PEP_ID=MMETSP0418-20121206/2575_1 /TAXON_ID=1158023 /ORGANISM="Astrosyne radiata, Strain 13vi08-1A" /LENGTH=434 /DNA_ID=CAMNT_0004455165 /DNA_START=295 /DNA_END=1599 /DNA_ORIENTATION=-